MSTAASNLRSTAWFSLRGLPSWLASLIVHLTALVLLVLVQFNAVAARHGSAIEANFSDPGGAGVLDSGTSDGGQHGQSPLVAEGPPVLDKLDLDSLGLDSAQQSIDAGARIELPGLRTQSTGKSAESLAGFGGSGIGAARGIEGKSIGFGDGSKPGLGRGKTSFYGVEAEGSKFVYVFDRSESMGYAFYSEESSNEFGGVPIRAAKAELLASIDELNSSQQFHIVFYNHQPMLFKPTMTATKLFFATTENKRSARYFVSEMPAAGGTHHVPALEMAIRMKPDVIFLLTDGEEKDDPTAEDIKELERLNNGRASINLIQFAQEPRPESTLVQLAKESRGKYQFIDVRRAGARARKSVLQNDFK